MKIELERKAEKLLSMLENSSLNNIIGLRSISIIDYDELCDDELCGEDLPRIGLANVVGSFQPRFQHFYIFVDDVSVYFSKDIICVRYIKEDDHPITIYQNKLEELVETYFQISTSIDVFFSKKFYERIFEFTKYFNWKILNE